MTEFSGKVVRGNGVNYYQVMWDDQALPLCHTDLFTLCAAQWLPDNWRLLTQSQKRAHLDTLSYAWGYEGYGPELLAIVLLGFYGTRAYMGSIRGHLYHCPKPLCDGGAPFVKAHFKAFTSEVIANLPDNWTMTMEDIDKWVKSKQNQNENIPKG